MTDVAILCDALCHVLGNTCRIIRTTRSYEWNVSGRGAELARQCFCEHATEQQKTVERVAYHIIGLRGRPILDYSDEVLRRQWFKHWYKEFHNMFILYKLLFEKEILVM